MTKKNDIAIIFTLVSLVIIATYIFYINYYDNERNVYISFFSQFDYEPIVKDAAFMSVVSYCGAQPSHIDEASNTLFENFYAANSENSLPANISKFSSMVNVVGWKDTLRLHKANSPNIARINSEKYIVHMSRIGFDKEKKAALMCIETRSSSSLYLFKKVDSRGWEIDKSRVIWVT